MLANHNMENGRSVQAVAIIARERNRPGERFCGGNSEAPDGRSDHGGRH